MNNATVKLVIADDDQDDCFFFKDALDELSLSASLTMVHDGEQLMQYLETVSTSLPDVLFLDLNMPRKGGYECLIEIKKNAALKNLPVIICSTSYDEKSANQLYKAGADYYICKPADFGELKNVVHHAIKLSMQKRLQRSKETFYINKFKFEREWKK